MIDVWAQKTSNYLLDNQIIEEEQAELVIYGLEYFYSFLGNVILLVIFSIVFRAFMPMFGFFLGLFLARSFAGGYHAQSYQICFLLSILMFVINGIVAKLFLLSINIGVTMALAVISMFILLALAPLENPNRPLSEQDKRKFQLLSRLVWFAISSVGIVGTFLVAHQFSTSLLLGLFTASLAVLIAYLMDRKDVTHEEEIDQIM